MTTIDDLRGALHNYYRYNCDANSLHAVLAAAGAVTDEAQAAPRDDEPSNQRTPDEIAEMFYALGDRIVEILDQRYERRR